MTELESMLVSVNSVLMIIGDVLLCHIEHKRINVISELIATIPVLRCVASTHGSLGSFKYDQCWALIKNFFFEVL
jgi:hypothetical protein